MENIYIEKSDNIDYIMYQKMKLIFNSLDNGWTIKKNQEKDLYIFTKKHDGKKEIYLDNYLTEFIKNNL